MAIPKVPDDGKLLIRDHENILASLREGRNQLETSQAEVSAAVDAMTAQEVLRILKEIPVEELNRDKRGIRVKTLRDHGYETIADVHFASWAKLEAINGISDTGASEIKKFTQELTEQARQGVKIRLSLDDKSQEATRLVLALSRWIHTRELGKVCIELLDSQESSICTAIRDMAPSKNAIRWLFTGKENKLKARDAYGYLAAIMTEGYGPKAKETVEKLRDAQKPSGESAWAEFEKNPIGFYNALEGICHGILGTADGAYGLSEDLSQGVQDEPVYTDGLLCQLRHYQRWGVQYILHQKCVLLGDEMGLGKTIQAIAAMVSLKNTGGTHFMVVCPASVLENWCREIPKHSVLKVQKVHGSKRQAALEAWLQDGGVAVTTYETTGTLQLENSFRLSMLVVDEAHYIKNPGAQRTQNVKRLCGYADRLLFMTGTALENRVDEMISLISILQPEVAATVQNMVSLSVAPQFQKEVAPVYCRRKREDVLTELPELIETQEWCTLYPEEEQVYEAAVLNHHFNQARRVSWNAGSQAPSAKAARMLELIRQAAEEGRKVIVFSFFLDTLGRVQELLGEKCMPIIDGSVPSQHRQKIIDDFDGAPAGTVLAAQIQAGGTGLNIQSASVVILCEPQLKPSVENQAISRAYRMGQTRNVLVYRLLCENTVDERITALLEEKQATFDAFADESVAAKENRELDSKSFNQLMEAEVKRIEAKNQNPPTAEPSGEEG